MHHEEITLLVQRRKH